MKPGDFEFHETIYTVPEYDKKERFIKKDKEELVLTINDELFFCLFVCFVLFVVL